MQIQFEGAARRVTGSKHLITTENGQKILLDCGMFQGIGTTDLNLTFGFDPKSVDFLVLSHAHIDHTGLVPRLVKQGFNGPIYCTKATESLCEIMLHDSAGIQEKDLKRVNDRRIKRGEEPIEALYDKEDVDLALSLLVPIGYHEKFQICPGVQATYYDAGHIIGSAGVYLEFEEMAGKKTLFFTGDIGRPGDQILRSPEPFPQADYIISESTYGNRLHETPINMKQQFYEIVQQTCVVNQGKLIIPAFSVDRTQEVIYALDQLSSEGRLPKIDVYVDSPLSVKATMIMKKHREDFNKDILKYIERDGDAFAFKNLHYVTKVEDSKAINDSKKPCIIISASGMAEAGRIKHHIANNILDRKNTILIVGYCSPNTLGYNIREGNSPVKIFGKEFDIIANVESMASFSAHGDYIEMIDYLRCQNQALVKKLFLVHGDYEVQKEYKLKLEKVGFQNIEIPAQGEIFNL